MRWTTDELDRAGVLFIVDEVLGELVGHELDRLGLHVSRHKGGQVEAGRAVQLELVADEAVGGIWECEGGE